jgi:hypothetical protein
MLTAIRVLGNQRALANAIADMARLQQAETLRKAIIKQVFFTTGYVHPYKKDREEYFSSFVLEYNLEELKNLSVIIDELLLISPDPNVVRASVDTLISAVYLDGRHGGTNRVDAIRDYGYLCPKIAEMKTIVSTIPRLKLMGTRFMRNAEAHVRAVTFHDTIGHSCYAKPCLNDVALIECIDNYPEHVEEIIRYKLSRDEVPNSIETILEVTQLGAVRDGWL